MSKRKKEKIRGKSVCMFLIFVAFFPLEYQSIGSGPAGGHSVWSSASLLSGKSLSSVFV